MSPEFDFDKAIDRRGTASLKWERYTDSDIIPLWVADMDFASPPAIIRALHERVEHGISATACLPRPWRRRCRPCSDESMAGKSSGNG